MKIPNKHISIERVHHDVILEKAKEARMSFSRMVEVMTEKLFGDNDRIKEYLRLKEELDNLGETK